MSGTYHGTPLELSSHQNLIDEDDYPSTTQISSTTSQAAFPLQNLQPAVAPPSFSYQPTEGNRRNSLTLSSLNPYYNDALEDEEEHEQFYSDQSGLMRQISNMSDANLPLTAHAASTSPASPEIQGLITGKSGGSGGNGGNGEDNVGRTVYINNPERNAQQKFIHNRISTAKYNFATFLPKFLYEQFSKYANLFFLFTGIVLSN